jgi:predicted Zn-dependent peptidase
VTGLRLCSTILLLRLILPAQNLKEFEKKVTEFTLPNGLHFIVAERHEAPVVSFHTYVNAGSVDDPSGRTGIAHMFEHMAFKGTETIGTKDWPSEKKALDAVEEAYDLLDAERNKGPKADASRISLLEGELKVAIDRAQNYVEPNEYSRIIEESGGLDMNAQTTLDSTEYFYSLPSNRIELWFYMESQRFLHPVFREFYKERDVVMEERRMRVDSSPNGKLVEDFLATAFAAHPYRNPGTGWPSDIANLRRADALAFYQTYYSPANITMAIVGDVNPAEAKRMAERYFSALPTRPLPPLLRTQEPPQPGPKTAVLDAQAQPLLIVGYKRPDEYDKDDSIFDILSLIFSSGRTGLLYKDLVQDKKIAVAAQAGPTFPAGRYQNLFIFFVQPALGHTVDENQKALDAAVARFEAKPVDDQTLQRVKTKLRAAVVRRLGNNAGLAAILTTYYATYGDWRKLFTEISQYDKVTPADLQRVAQQYFVANHRTIAYIAQPSRSGQTPGGQQ